MNRHYASRIFWGMVIVAFGGGFLLKQLGIIEFDIGDIVSVFWPVFLIFAGFDGLLFHRQGGGGGALWGGIMIAIGFIFLGRNLDWFDWSVGDLFRFVVPVVLILFGLNMIFRPKGESRRLYDGHDDWQTYKPGGYVPPAPPLHPDPTLAGTDGGENLSSKTDEPVLSNSGYDEVYRPDLSKHHREHIRQMNRSMREHMRELRRQEHYKRRNPSGRVEWWDNNPNAMNRSGFIGDIHIGHDHWELKPLNISHFIGDTVIDLTRAHIPAGETKITISSFIGDVKIYLPNDYEVGIHVVSSAFIGVARVMDMNDNRMFRSMDFQTPYYEETEKRIKLVCSTFIGDVRVTKVG
ncbi:cell wall-active antibiotics response protein LiaF [Paenibacillus xylaniclasticus]|uniref:cell wall-active antibiotics response protein LiaF n=1 Tax=Paenibacillus xylaniclasticus TaxID=588083 RepID=UPI000FDA5472|nr:MULTISPECIES: cell wall-active antibiotics response protein LiaF [Paenibacillus]GFN31638.1 hypothetical protein PCURB6_18980 [Paenibacillus curdlanolyticus]